MQGRQVRALVAEKLLPLPEIDTSGRPNVLSSRTVFVSERLASSVPSILSDRPSLASSSEDVVEALLAPSANSASSIPVASLAPPTTASSTLPGPATSVPQAKVRPVSPNTDLAAYKRRRLWLTLASLATLLIVGIGGLYLIRYVRNTSLIQNLQERRNRMMSLNNMGKIARALECLCRAARDLSSRNCL